MNDRGIDGPGACRGGPPLEWVGGAVEAQSSVAWAELQRLVSRFEAAWRLGPRPAIDDFLPADGPGRAAVIVELAHADLELRLKAGDCARVEEYLGRFPGLAADRRATLELIATEYEFRRRRDSEVAPDEYRTRFPGLGEALPEEADRPLAGDDPTPERSQLGKFALLEVVGRGSFGIVYRARDTELDRIVAVKLPRLGGFPSPEDVDRFLREARSAARLRHPGIVAVHEVGRIEGQLYLVYDYVAGVTLAERLGSGGLSCSRAAELAACVAESLDHAHRLGVIHRDIKPSNILLDDEGRPYIADFGLAKRDAGEATLTLEGQVLGTPAYMSPEQARGDAHKVDPRSDVYGLGIVLYEALTGVLPFRGRGRMLLAQVLEEDPRPPRRLNDTIPRDLETVCLKAIAKDPGDRYPSAAAFAADLRRHLEGRPVLARPLGPFAKLWRRCRRKPAMAALVATIALVGSLGFAGVIWQWRRAEAHLALAERERRRVVSTLGQAHETVNALSWLAMERPLPVTEEDRTRLDRDLLNKVIPHYQDFAAHFRGHPDFRTHLAQAGTRLAGLATRWGTQERALEAWQEAATAWEAVVREGPSVLPQRFQWANALSNIGKIHRQAGRPADASRALDRAEAIWVGMLREGPGKVDTQSRAETYLYLASLQRQAGKPAEARRSFESARDLWRALVRVDPESVRSRKHLARAVFGIGSLEESVRRPTEARRAYLEAQAIWEGMTRETFEDADLLVEAAMCEYRLGRLHAREGRSAEALHHNRRVVERLTRLVRAGPASVNARCRGPQDQRPARRPRVIFDEMSGCANGFWHSLKWQGAPSDSGVSPELRL